MGPDMTSWNNNCIESNQSIVKVNGENVENLRHKEVQEKIVRAGNNFNLTVNRYSVVLNKILESEQ